MASTPTPKVFVEIRVSEGGYGNDTPISVEVTEGVVGGTFTDVAGLANIRETIDRLLADAQGRAHDAARAIQQNILDAEKVAAEREARESQATA